MVWGLPMVGTEKRSNKGITICRLYVSVKDIYIQRQDGQLYTKR